MIYLIINLFYTKLTLYIIVIWCTVVLRTVYDFEHIHIVDQRNELFKIGVMKQ